MRQTCCPEVWKALGVLLEGRTGFTSCPRVFEQRLERARAGGRVGAGCMNSLGVHLERTVADADTAVSFRNRVSPGTRRSFRALSTESAEQVRVVK